MLSPNEKSRVPDLLDRIREELSARLDALRPLVDEHSRLDAAMQALGDIKPPPAGAAAARSSAKTTKPRTQTTAPAKPRKRAPRGANREAVLRAASQRPGATSAELAAVSGVEANTLSGLNRRLVKAGELQQRELPTGRTGYAIADTPPAQSSGAGSAGADDSVVSGDDAEPAAPPDMT
jgi:hypothetical protein